jgi:hypothetical protein
VDVGEGDCVVNGVVVVSSRASVGSGVGVGNCGAGVGEVSETVGSELEVGTHWE